jgi:hypothetical protein
MKFGLTGLTMLTVTFLAASSHAASVTFQSPTAITDTSVLDTILLAYPGATLEQAVGFGLPSVQSVSTTGGQTINFAVGAHATSAPAGTSTELFYSGVQSGSTLYTGDTGSAAFNTVLKSDGWASSATGTKPQTLQIGGLTIGNTYAFTLLACDMRSTSSSRTEQYSDAISGGNTSASFSTANAQAVTGTFTADSSVQSLYVLQTTIGVSTWDTTISGFTLYAVPEPGTGAILAGGFGILLAGFRLRKQK